MISNNKVGWTRNDTKSTYSQGIHNWIFTKQMKNEIQNPRKKKKDNNGENNIKQRPGWKRKGQGRALLVGGSIPCHLGTDLESPESIILYPLPPISIDIDILMIKNQITITFNQKSNISTHHKKSNITYMYDNILSRLPLVLVCIVYGPA